MPMLLTPKWKKSIIPRIVEKIFLSYNEADYRDKLCYLINAINRYERSDVYLGIKWKDQMFIGFKSTNQNPFKLFTMTTTHPYFNDFAALLKERDDYNALTSRVTNYLSVGMAMCNSTECVSAVFPESVLNILNSIAVSTHFKPIAPTVPKHIAFIQKHESIVVELEMQLVTNIIAPDYQNAENSVQ